MDIIKKVTRRDSIYASKLQHEQQCEIRQNIWSNAIFTLMMFPDNKIAFL